MLRGRDSGRERERGGRRGILDLRPGTILIRGTMTIYGTGDAYERATGVANSETRRSNRNVLLLHGLWCVARN